MGNQGLDLSLNKLTLIEEHRNISDYENIPRLGIKKNKLKEIEEDVHNLRYAFSKKDADKYRKLYYDIKNYSYYSEPEIEEIRKKFNKLEKSLNVKKAS